MATPEDEWNGTPYELRFGQVIRGHILPFGCHVEYIPNGDKEKALQHTFDTTTVSGIFIGYRQRPGGYWPGGYLVLPFSSIENAVSHQAVCLRKIPDIIHPKKILSRLKTAQFNLGHYPMPTKCRLKYENSVKKKMLLS